MPTAIVVRMGGILGLLFFAGCPHTEVRPFAAPGHRVHQPASAGVGISKVRPEHSPAPGELLPVNPLTPPPGPLPSAAELETETGNAAEREKIAIGKLQDLGGQVTREIGGEKLVVDLSLAKAGDDVTDWLAQLPRIKKLDLSGTDITDAALARLAPLEHLEFLNLANTAVGDAGLESLAKMKTIKYLVLNGTRITDKSLAHLAKFPKLEGVSLLNTSATPLAVETLKKQKPQCAVLFRSAQESPSEPTKENSAGATKWAPLGTADARNASAEQCEFVTSSWQTQTADDWYAPSGKSAIPPQTAEELRDPEFLDAVSQVYLTRGEWSKAADILRQAVELDEGDQRLRYHLGIALGRSGDLDASFSELSTATGEAAAHYNMGIILYENALEKSHQHFQEALVLDPSLNEAREWIRHVQSQMGQDSGKTAPSEVKILPASGFANRQEESK